eukprot:TRINITY_DN414_c0_g1_i2.p1 TRINITY_DN414_c0_g1~~TRINITY_DN414_c0_g1_i2.p1  ORF type:complete len:178 (-),score=40.04 TRINITY_DN414_c0_g1_i2:30-563(-)
MTGLGIPPQTISRTFGVAKAYLTRVGGGPFPTELKDEIGAHMGKVGHEFGTTTGRPRRCGWFDAAALRYSNMINGYTDINLTKLDVLTGLKEVKMCVGYKHNGRVLDTFPSSLQTLGEAEVVYESLPGWSENITSARKFTELPANAQNYVKRLESVVGVKVSSIGVGPGREDIVYKD